MRGSERCRAGGWPCCPDPLQLPPQDHHGSLGPWHAAPPSPRGSPEPPSASPGAAASALKPSRRGRGTSTATLTSSQHHSRGGSAPRRAQGGCWWGGGLCLGGELGGQGQSRAPRHTKAALGTPKLPLAHQGSPRLSKVPLARHSPRGLVGAGFTAHRAPPMAVPPPCSVQPYNRGPQPLVLPAPRGAQPLRGAGPRAPQLRPLTAGRCRGRSPDPWVARRALSPGRGGGRGHPGRPGTGRLAEFGGQVDEVIQGTRAQDAVRS